MIPSYDFSKVKTVVSVGADFLGTWISPIEFSKQFAQTRKINEHHREMSRHYQFESNLSLTGSNADYRTPILPSQVGPFVAAMYNAIAAKAGQAKVSGGNAGDVAHLTAAANELYENTRNDIGFKVPKIYWNQTSKRILCLDRINGISIREVENLKSINIDIKKLAKNIIQHFLLAAVRDGFYHPAPFHRECERPAFSYRIEPDNAGW